jgi:hypothetical protein
LHARGDCRPNGAAVSDAPLRELLHTTRAYAPLTAAGYVAFGWDTNDTGPVSFDVRRRLNAQPYFDSFRRLVTRCLVDYAHALDTKTFDRRAFSR